MHFLLSKCSSFLYVNKTRLSHIIISDDNMPVISHFPIIGDFYAGAYTICL